MIVAVDVDLTVVDLTPQWWLWMVAKSGHFKDVPEGPLDYYLPCYFEKELLERGVDGMDFFYQEGIYDGAQPLPGAVETLQWLSDHGAEIVFVSVIMGKHAESKQAFLEKHFPFCDGILFTYDSQYAKHFVAADAFIDDRVSNINLSSAEHNLLMHSRFTQDAKLQKPCTTVGNWWEAAEHLKNIFKLPPLLEEETTACSL